MKSASAPNGFTLIEVIVALAIAAGALILIVTANQEALKRGIQARQRVALEQAVESKWDEIRSGVERENSGSFKEPIGLSWRIETREISVANRPEIKGLRVVAFKVFDAYSGDQPIRVFTMLKYAKPDESIERGSL